MASKKPVKESLEYSMKRLEQIVESMEGGTISLEEAVDLYEEGIKLSKECAEKLKATELKIKKLSKTVNGLLTLEETEEE